MGVKKQSMAVVTQQSHHHPDKYNPVTPKCQFEFFLRGDRSKFTTTARFFSEL
jgi:hypothetical protein